MEVEKDNLYNLSASSSPHSFSFHDLSSGSLKEFTHEWSNVLKDIAVISSDWVIDLALIMNQVVPIFMQIFNFIFLTISSPIPIVELEGYHLAKKLFYFASENYMQIDGIFLIINKKKLSYSIT